MATERRRRPRPLAVASASLATFLAILTLLSAQLHAGHDPALGQVVASASQAGGKQIVTRTSGGSQPVKHAGTPITTHASGGGGGDD